MDPRQDALRGWLGAALAGAPFELSVASADASFRRYFRVQLRESARSLIAERCGARSFIAMDAPPPHEALEPWLDIATRIVAAGAHAPRVHAADHAQGFLLLDDLGDTTYQVALGRGADPAPLYADALAALARMQGRIAIDGLPRYDRALLRRELELFREWACGRHLGLTLSSSEQSMLDRAFTWLEDAALAMPVAFVHRDYHARNLMVVAEGDNRHGVADDHQVAASAASSNRNHNNPGILDFQDAVAGPVAYDLVSLTRDAYLRWPAATIAAWTSRYHALARAEGAPLPASVAEFSEQHDVIGLQRQLKVVGIFCRLAHRDGKRGYLDDIPLVLDHLLEVMPQHAALADLDAFLRARIAPGFGVAA
jgi:aminoglycoside/choline kinase family phosphotransferase